MTLLTPEKQKALLFALDQTLDVPGCIIEVGVYKGGSLKLIARHAVMWGKEIYGFDTFEGIPDLPFHTPPDTRHVGRFGCPLEIVQANLRDLAANVKLVKTVFPYNTQRRPISFGHFDVDTYASTLACLRYADDCAVHGARVVVDDYDWADTPGVSKAVHEFLDSVDERWRVAFRVEGQITLKRVTT